MQLGWLKEDSLNCVSKGKKPELTIYNAIDKIT